MIMPIIFFDHQGLGYYEFASQGEMVNRHFYMKVLSRLVNKIRQNEVPLKQAKPGFFAMAIHPLTHPSA